MSVEISEATDADLAAIQAIHNQAVAETTASWSYRVVDLDDRKAWFAEKRSRGHPILAARRGGELIGYAYYGPFRAYDGYLHTVEDSVYVRRDSQSRGVGRMLLAELINHARRRRLHAMIGAIEAGNAASISLHEKAGFTEVGRLPQVGAKFGRWLDLVLLQLTLNDDPRPPAAP